MKPDKIFNILDLAYRARQNGHIFNPCFISPPGIGKTEIIQQWANKRGLNSIVMSLATFDPPDFKGFPITQVVNGKQKLSFATPDFWPEAGEGIIILEELNRAPNSIVQCILSLSDARRGFDGYKLPNGYFVVAAINPETAHYDTNTLDPAVKDRFEFFEVVYDKQTFLDYARGSEWDASVINFVESGLWQYAEPGTQKVAGSKYISPRTFSKLNAARLSGVSREDEQAVYESILGLNVARDFLNFLYNETPVLLQDLRRDLKGSLAKLEKFSDPNNYKNGMISVTVRDIVADNTIDDELLAKVAEVLPVGQATALIFELEQKRDDAHADTGILGRLVKKHPSLKKRIKETVNYSK